MSLLRYGFQEAQNIARAKKEADRFAMEVAARQYKRAIAVVGSEYATVLQLEAETEAREDAVASLTTALGTKQPIPSVDIVSSDADYTFQYPGSGLIQIHNGTLTANRLTTLSATGAYDGMVVYFSRTGSGAFDWNIGSIKALAPMTWLTTVFEAGTFYPLQYGAL